MRHKINEKLTEIWDYPKIGLINKHGDHYYFPYNSGLSNQNIIYKIKEKDSYKLNQADILSGTEVFLDPNKLSEDGTAALGQKIWSPNGRYLAYQVMRAGSDWATIYIRDAETGQDLAEELHWIKFSRIAWTHDNLGFFYNKFDPPASISGEERQGTETEKVKN